MHEKKLIYYNIVNGVPFEQIGAIFNKTHEEIQEIFDFVTLKIRGYMFKKSMLMVDCTTVEKAQANRTRLLPVVDMLNMDVIPIYKLREEVIEIRN